MRSNSILWPCSPSTMQQSSLSQFPERSERSPCQVQASGKQVMQRSTMSSTATSLNSQQNRILDFRAVVRIRRTPLKRRSLYNLSKELVRRTVKAEKEPSEEVEEKLEANLAKHNLGMSKAQNLQTIAQIFCSTMFWIVLFFMGSIWDGENCGKRPRK